MAETGEDGSPRAGTRSAGLGLLSPAAPTPFVLRYTGILLIYCGALIVAFMLFYSEKLMEPLAFTVRQPGRQLGDLLAALFLPITTVGSAILFVGLGYRLLSASGVTSDFVLPAQDKELLSKLIEDGNEQGVRLYLDISSIKGTTGTFTKLGITGLPLATIFLTCFFALLGYVSSGAANQTFLDLAKLTLGAFIGSFVQRQAERASERRNRVEPLEKAGSKPRAGETTERAKGSE